MQILMKSSLLIVDRKGKFGAIYIQSDFTPNPSPTHSPLKSVEKNLANIIQIPCLSLVLCLRTNDIQIYQAVLTYDKVGFFFIYFYLHTYVVNSHIMEKMQISIIWSNFIYHTKMELNVLPYLDIPKHTTLCLV